MLGEVGHAQHRGAAEQSVGDERRPRVAVGGQRRQRAGVGRRGDGARLLGGRRSRRVLTGSVSGGGTEGASPGSPWSRVEPADVTTAPYRVPPATARPQTDAGVDLNLFRLGRGPPCADVRELQPNSPSQSSDGSSGDGGTMVGPALRAARGRRRAHRDRRAAVAWPHLPSPPTRGLRRLQPGAPTIPAPDRTPATAAASNEPEAPTEPTQTVPDEDPVVEEPTRRTSPEPEPVPEVSTGGGRDSGRTRLSSRRRRLRRRHLRLRRARCLARTRSRCPIVRLPASGRDPVRRLADAVDVLHHLPDPGADARASSSRR